jgi:hypothetical protein
LYSDCYVFNSALPGAERKWSARNHLFEGDILEPLLFDCFVPSPTPLFRRRVFDAIGVYDETFKRHEPEDWDLWLRISARYPAGLVNEPLAQLRVHPSSLTASEDRALAAEGALAVLQRAFDRNPRLSEHLRRRVLATWYLRFGRGLMGVGRLAEARTFLSNSIAHAPLSPGAYALWIATYLGRPLSGVLRSVNRTIGTAFARNPRRRGA